MRQHRGRARRRRDRRYRRRRIRVAPPTSLRPNPYRSAARHRAARRAARRHGGPAEPPVAARSCRAAEVGAPGGEEGARRDLERRGQVPRPRRGQGVRVDLWCKVSEGGRQDQRRRRAAAGVLRLPGRALDPSENYKSDRIYLRHRAEPEQDHQGPRLPRRRNRHGLQADRGGPVTLAGGQRAPSRGARPRRREVRERQTRRTARRHHRYRGGRIKDLDPQVLTIALGTGAGKRLQPALGPLRLSAEPPHTLRYWADNASKQAEAWSIWPDFASAIRRSTTWVTGDALRDEVHNDNITPLIGIFDMYSASLAAQHYGGMFVSGFGFAAVPIRTGCPTFTCCARR